MLEWPTCINLKCTVLYTEVYFKRVLWQTLETVQTVEMCLYSANTTY